MDRAIIEDLLDHPRVTEMQNHMHHSIPKYDHLMRSARYSYRLAPFLGADRRTCVRAAMLHDIDSRKGTLRTHGAIAAQVARDELGEPEPVSQAIISHMYPLGGPRPTTREGWVLAMADKMASLRDITQFVGGLFTGKSLRERRRLLELDPHHPKGVARRPLRVRRRMFNFNA